MCCFSRPVDFVANTRIFARPAGGGRQFLAYQMEYLATEDLAMILPLPVRLPAHPGSVRFIALNKDRHFFDNLENGFPDVEEEALKRAGIPTNPPTAPHYMDVRSGVIGARAEPAGAIGAMASPLAVQRVGDYDASFVPTLNDFDRLDARFKLPRSVWNQIPLYRDYGFAVFKLRKPALSAPRPSSASDDDLPPDEPGNRPHRMRIRNIQNHPHPMAFAFETRMLNALFFPTVHIHDGKIHPREEFDHTLYMQGRVRPTHLSRVPDRIPRWLLREDRTRPLPKGAPRYRDYPPESRLPAHDLPEMVPLDLLRRQIRAGRGYYLPWGNYGYAIGEDGFPVTPLEKTPEERQLRESRDAISRFHKSTAGGILALNERYCKRELRGEFANHDVIVPLG